MAICSGHNRKLKQELSSEAALPETEFDSEFLTEEVVTKNW